MPAEDWKYEDIHNGMATLGEIHFTGWSLIQTFADWTEVLSLQTKPREFFGGYELLASFDVQSRAWTAHTAAAAASQPQLG